MASAACWLPATASASGHLPRPLSPTKAGPPAFISSLSPGADAMHGTNTTHTPPEIREKLNAPAGHNGGPPLEAHTPEWGSGGIGNYFYWKAAHRAAWKKPSPGIVLFRIRKAERLGLTYEEYTLEILERGRHLQEDDVERIAAIKRKRRVKR